MTVIMTDARGFPAGDKARAGQRRRLRRAGIAVKRTAFFGAGSTLMVVAFASVPAPVPGLGLILFVVALYFLARGSKTAKRAVAWGFRRLPALSRGLERIKPKLPRPMRRFIDSNAARL